MRTITKLGAYGLVLAAALGGGAAVGAVAGPIDVDGGAPHVSQHEAAPTVEEPAEPPAGGLLVSEDGSPSQPESGADSQPAGR